MCLLSPLIPTAMVLSSRWRHSRRTRQALPLSTPLARSDKSYRDRRTWHAATLSSFPGLFSSRVLLFRSRRHEEETVFSGTPDFFAKIAACKREKIEVR